MDASDSQNAQEIEAEIPQTPGPVYTHGWVSLYGGEMLRQGRRGKCGPGVEELKRIAWSPVLRTPQRTGDAPL
jgi:hypothetical protein